MPSPASPTSWAPSSPSASVASHSSSSPPRGSLARSSKPTTPPLPLVSRLALLSAQYLSFGCSDVTFSSAEPYWRQARRLCVSELLARDRMAAFRLIRCQEVHRLLRSISSSAAAAAADSDGQAIDLSARSSAASPSGGASPLPASDCRRCSQKHRQGPVPPPPCCPLPISSPLPPVFSPPCCTTLAPNPAALFPSLPPPPVSSAALPSGGASPLPAVGGAYRNTGKAPPPISSPPCCPAAPLPATPSRLPPRHDICDIIQIQLTATSPAI